MSFATVLSLLFSGLNVTLPQFVLVITVLGSIIFIAVELRFGLMILFFMLGIETLVYWRVGVSDADMNLVIIVLMSSFVLMTLSLLLMKSSEQTYQGLI